MSNTISNPIIEGAPPDPTHGSPVPTPPTPTLPAPPTPSLTDDQAQQLTTQLLAAGEALAPFAEVISVDDKKHMAKPRPGIELQVPLLVTLAKMHGVQLTDYPIDQFLPDVAFVARMSMIQAPAVQLNQLIADTVFATRSRYFSALSTVYSTLSTLATRDASLSLALEPLRKIFVISPKASTSATKGAKKGEGTPQQSAQAPGATTVPGSAAAAVAPTSLTPLVIHERRREKAREGVHPERRRA